MAGRLRTELPRRAFAFVASPIAAAAGLWLLMPAFISTSLLRAPNPDPALDGEPCCPYPDTWIDVALGGALVIALVLIAVGLIALAIALGGVAFTGKPPALLRRHGPKLTTAALASASCLFVAPMLWALSASA